MKYYEIKPLTYKTVNGTTFPEPRPDTDHDDILCSECHRIATKIVNDIAPVCDYHGEFAKMEGFIVADIHDYTPEKLCSIMKIY